MEVSINGDPQNGSKWLLCNGKSYEHGWFRGTPISGNLYILISIFFWGVTTSYKTVWSTHHSIFETCRAPQQWWTTHRWSRSDGRHPKIPPGAGSRDACGIVSDGLTWGILWFMVDITIFTMETHHFSWENSLFLWWFSADFPFNQYIDGWIIVMSLEWWMLGELSQNVQVSELPAGYVKIAMENGHRNSGFTQL